MNLYNNIRQRRQALGLSQEELANKLGYKTKSMICKIEAGKIDLSQSKIVAFANALNTTPGELMGLNCNIDYPASIHPVVQQAKAIAAHQINSTRNFLETLCKNNPKALAALDRLSITENGEIKLDGGDTASEAVLQYQIKSLITALEAAADNGDGTKAALWNPNK